MEFRPLGVGEESLAEELLRQIYREAGDRFSEARGTESEKLTLMFEIDGVRGIQTILAGQNFTVCYISFSEDIECPELFAELESNIAPYLEKAEPDSVFVNINGRNPSIASHFMGKGFHKDKESLEYTFEGNDWPKVAFPPGIEPRGFEDQDFEDYIWLLDTAFRPVLLRESRPLDPHRRNLKKSYSMMKFAYEDGNFQAYWKEDSVVGLYVLRGNILLDLAVTPAYQGQGLGKAIMNDVLDTLLVQRRYPRVLLYVSATNKPALALYESMGFRPTASHIDLTFVPPKE